MRSKTTYTILIAILITGCANRFRSPVVEVPGQYLYSAPTDTTAVTVNVNWWEIFSDTTLNALIEHALENNQNVAIALSRIEQARMQMNVDKAQYLPGLSLGISGEGDYTTYTKIEQEYIVKPGISWEISLFGALKNTSRASKAQILSAEYSYNGIMLSLVAEVATTYFTLIQNRQSLAISQRTYQLRRKSTAIIDSMVRYGMSSGVDLQQSQGLTATAAAAIPQYERGIAQTQNALCLLLGENPQYIKSHLSYSNGNYDSLPSYIPVGLPSDLLMRRPDIMEAYANLMTASARIGIAQAARFPSISLTADGGVLATAVKSLTATPYPWAWNGLLSITQPIFQFSKLRKAEQIAKEGYKQAELNYRKSVIAAFGDVENALIAISTLRDQSQKYHDLVVANEKIQRMTSELYKEGLTDYLNLLDAERTLYSSQIEYSNLLQQQFSAYVALYKALGGGW